MPRINLEAWENSTAWEDMTEEERAEVEYYFAQIGEEDNPRVLSEGMTEEERSVELLSYIIDARENYVELLGGCPIEGFIFIDIKESVPIYTASEPVQLEPGRFLLRVGNEVNEASIYALSVDFSDLLDQVENGDLEAEDLGNGHSGIRGNLEIKGALQRVEIELGKPLLYLEVLTFLAMKHAETEEERQRIFSLAYLYGQTVEEKTAEGGEPIVTITTRPIEYTDFPVDKINARAWKLLEGARDGQFGFDIEVGENGDLEVDFNMAPEKSGKKALVTYCVDFSGVESSITKRLEPYDKRVCIAVAALFNLGYEVMTLQMIYNAMGNPGKAGKADKSKIDKSLTKMSGARLTLDNSQEVLVHNRSEFTYDGAVVPMERIRAIVNGQLVDSAIHVFREPPPISFARERKQFTTIEVALLDTPLSKTSANIQLEDYLIEQIARIKAGRRNSKMLYETIYENTGIKTNKQKQRAAEKIEKLLIHYDDCGYIEGYEIEPDGVRILYKA